MNMLALADFAGMDSAQVKAKICEDFGIEPASVESCEIVVAYMSVGDWGCDSGAFIVFRTGGNLYEVNGSHCSCYGFSEAGLDGGPTQWQPEETDVWAISRRDDWALACGGYDDDREANAAAIRAHLAQVQP